MHLFFDSTTKQTNLKNTGTHDCHFTDFSTFDLTSYAVWKKSPITELSGNKSPTICRTELTAKSKVQR